MCDLPHSEAIERALLAYFVNGRCAAAPRCIYPILAEDLGLSDEQRSLKRPDGKGSLFENKVQWAREGLAKKGILDRGVRGLWMMTESFSRRVAEDSRDRGTKPRSLIS